jgi:hypothetical protein
MEVMDSIVATKVRSLVFLKQLILVRFCVFPPLLFKEARQDKLCGSHTVRVHWHCRGFHIAYNASEAANTLFFTHIPAFPLRFSFRCISP